MTEEKLSTLISLYGEFIPDSADLNSFLLEILTACDGSLKDASCMLNDTLGINRSLENQTKVKRKCANDIDGGKRRHKIQKSLNYYINDESDKIKPVATDTVGKNAKKPIELCTKDDIESRIKYITYHEKVLPDDLADSLLEQLVKDDEGFSPYEFHLFGNKCSSNHTSKKFSSNPGILQGKDKVHYNGRQSTVYEYSSLLKVTQLLIEDIVNEAMTKMEPLPFQVMQPDWKGDVALVNKYGKADHLLWHSDRLTSIGPQPIVASLSLGCVREFRVRKSYPSNSQTYVLKPPHNSLVIMHAGFQEEYRHCIQKQTNNRASNLHPISKDVRINLTYRDYLNNFIQNSPRCLKCGSPMDLRRSFKDCRRRGQYIWQCAQHYTGGDCDGVRLACFRNDSLVVEGDKSQSSRWLADDDIAAKEVQDNHQKK